MLSRLMNSPMWNICVLFFAGPERVTSNCQYRGEKIRWIDNIYCCWNQFPRYSTLRALSGGPAVPYREKFCLIPHPDRLWSPHNDFWRFLPRDQSGQSQSPPLIIARQESSFPNIPKCLHDVAFKHKENFAFVSTSTERPVAISVKLKMLMYSRQFYNLFHK
jgi:hypothetical protein